MAAQADPIALAPAFANPDILNFSEPAAVKLFKSAIETLSIKFDCSLQNLQIFLDQACNKFIVNDCWLNILSISLGRDVAATEDLIESYGEIPYTDVRNHALTYVHENFREA